MEAIHSRYPYLQFLGVLKPASGNTEEWTPRTDVYGGKIYDPTKAPRTVMDFGVRLNSLGNLIRVGGEVLVNQNVEGVQDSYGSQVTGLGDIVDSDDAGNYVVGWSQIDSMPVGGVYTHSGYIRIYNADGTPRTARAIQLGQQTLTERSYAAEPFIAFSWDGTRIATSWVGMVPVFGSQGQSIGTPVVANPPANNEAYFVGGLDIDQNGDFVVVSNG